ncbi:hypothetical protein L1N85_03905 [Paenibacillus alkaliterrae]|uniref:hypothetical protein n=1 Tax=Paenibacillus alkaliterrae TaxID=320909 RepID=UPI001F200155|nr:hypothetical protein [Paenibacillus alkaliterrae]MCF2937576.1 hypothetical protein [Paenibacillus alkaliterrae]
MSRKEKFRSSRASIQQEKTAMPFNAGTDPSVDEALPPRRQKFPSSNQKVTKWYYNFLFLLFVCLVGGLFWYGLKFSE